MEKEKKGERVARMILVEVVEMVQAPELETVPAGKVKKGQPFLSRFTIPETFLLPKEISIKDEYFLLPMIRAQQN